MPARLAIRGGAPVREHPFHRWPVWDAADRARLVDVLESGVWSGEGPNERELERAFASKHGAQDALTVSNGTITLMLALRALGIRPGDEVLVPALSWIATATAVLESNAVPVMVDVDPETLCIDPAAVRASIGPRTVAVIPVHLYCCMADMDSLARIAGAKGIALIEDCAHAHGARWHGRGAGSLGALGSFSFQRSKPMTAGEGGALIGSDRCLMDKVYSSRNCGRLGPARGAPVLGGNHRMTEWQSAVLLGQLARLDDQTARREAAFTRLEALIRPLAALRPIARQALVSPRPQYRFVLRYDPDVAGIPLHRFIAAVQAEGVPVEPTYAPIYDNPLYATERMTWYPGVPTVERCPRAEDVFRRTAVTLPHHVLLGTERDIEDIAAAFAKVLANPGEAAGLREHAADLVRGLMRTIGRSR